MLSKISWFSLLFTVSLATLGCQGVVDPKLVELRNKFFAKVEPEHASTLTEAKSLLTEESDVVLFGQIFGGDFEPFEKGKAIFVLSEAPSDHGDGKKHEASECPFCRRKAEAAPIAQIQFQDTDGKTLPLGAEQLFDLRKGQIVVVQGRGKYESESDTLMITGSSLYVRP
jgi:hypothetical protein